MSFLTLLGKEMGMLFRNMVLYLLIAVIVLFYWSNYATEESWNEGRAPVPPIEISDQVSAHSGGLGGGDASEGTPPMPVYGFKKITAPELVAQRYLWMLEDDLEKGWTEQRIVFGVIANKSRLSERDREYMNESRAKLERVVKDPASYTGVEVRQIAADLDSELGGWTNYMREGVSFMEPIETFEGAMESYHALKAEYDKRVAGNQVFSGMARLFSDYMGLTAGLFPVFLAAFTMGRDRSSRMIELVSSRSIRAWRYVGARYLAHVILISLVYLLLAAVGAWQTAEALGGVGVFGDVLLIFLSYSVGWLIPTIMATTAFGLLISIVAGSGIAVIPLQMVWWFISVFPLIGDYRVFKLFLRFNTAAEAETYHRYGNAILANRLFYVFLALAMVAVAARIWERKRSSGKMTISRFGPKKRRAEMPLKSGGEG
ncbi:ABC transporter permease [Paenibacillus sp. CAU 1782]